MRYGAAATSSCLVRPHRAKRRLLAALSSVLRSPCIAPKSRTSPCCACPCGHWRCCAAINKPWVPDIPTCSPAINGRTRAGKDEPRGHATAAIQKTPYTFRDTFAARQVQAAVSLLKVSKLLGHTNVLMTQKYAHLSPEATGAEAGAVLDDLHSIKSTEGDNSIAPDTKPDALAQVTHVDLP